MEKSMKTPKIPHTDSLAELARFWDTHDLTDFEDELEEVHEPIFERRTEETVTIHLPTKEVEAVKRMAQAKGIGHTALIREWVLEKLHHA
jgi:predicted DNA binding CopG/RHH family protein